MDKCALQEKAKEQGKKKQILKQCSILSMIF